MRYRVEGLAAVAGVSVDTIRYYQAKELLPPPERLGRVGWYGDDHVDRLAHIKRLQGRGFSLAVIRRLVAGELDRADEELVAAVSEASPAGGNEQAWLTLAELGERSGIPLALLEAVAREGLLVPRLVGGQPRYSAADVEVAAAGLQLLGQGLPLAELLELAKRHDAAMRATAEDAVALFDRFVRRPLRQAGLGDEESAARLVEAFEVLLPATLAIVSHHFQRTLLSAAQAHIERVGSDDERRAVQESSRFEEAAWAG